MSGMRVRAGVLLLVLTAVTACSDTPVGPEDSTSGPPGQDAPTTEAANPPGQDQSLPEVTRQDMLQIWWDERGLEGPPEQVDLIREVSDTEYMPVQAECLTAVGFPPEVSGDSYTWEVPAAQSEAFTLADYRCAAQYPRLLAYSQPYTDEQMTLIYNWVAEETIPCYAEQGHHVSGMPTLESFLEHYRTTQTWWLPKDGMDPITFEEQEALELVCPRLPPQEVLYGE